jgi:predicted PurR-regulated permease PerM
MDFIRTLIEKPLIRKILTLLVLGLFLYLMRDMLNLLLLTFLFTYLMYNAQKFFQKSIEKVFTVKIKKVLVTLVLYTILTALIVLAIYKYIPIAFHQIVNCLK